MGGRDKKSILGTRNDMMDTRSGTIIDGRYEFGNTLGKGLLGFPIHIIQNFKCSSLEISAINNVPWWNATDILH